MKNTAPTLDEAVLKKWIGHTREREDVIDLRPANLLKATLDPARPDLAEGDPLPHGWHWMYFPEAPRMDRLGRDGHAAVGDFLPPVALPRRMWAGARLEFHEPIHVGERLRKHSEVTRVTRKSGRSGELCFVTVRHGFYRDSRLKLQEDHDIVYRQAPGADEPAADPATDEPAPSHRTISVTPTSTLLFRYSALTFNGHRIHYDLDFCRNEEGYPGLVVHAPLTATLMLGLAETHFAESGARFARFDQRSVRPLFHPDPFTLHLVETGDGCDIRAMDARGRAAARAVLTLA